jgi:hypothetical protein
LTIVQPLILFLLIARNSFPDASGVEVSKTFYALIGWKGLLFVDSLFVISGMEGDVIRGGQVSGRGI